MLNKLLSLILTVSILTLAFTSCKKEKEETVDDSEKEYTLDQYEEDTSTEEKSIYYVAMAVKNHGVIILKLDAENAPITVANFIKLVREDFYDGLTFHRVKNNFMIQGGDPNADGSGGSKDKIYGEFLNNGYYNTISHVRGVISMARRSDNNNSASSQFFIMNADYKSLDGDYAAFGYVIEGMSVVDSITKETVKYTDSQSGTIYDKSKQAVITEMKVIIYNEK